MGNIKTNVIFPRICWIIIILFGLGHRLSILSDYEHYIGTKRLWKSLSKMNDVVIKIFHNHKLIESDYDLIKDPIGVWSGPEYLILATTNKIIENLENRLTAL